MAAAARRFGILRGGGGGGPPRPGVRQYNWSNVDSFYYGDGVHPSDLDAYSLLTPGPYEEEQSTAIMKPARGARVNY